MNKKGFVQFIIFGILILIGLIITWFVIKAIVSLLITLVFWGLIACFVIFAVWVIYKLIKSSQKKGRRR